MLNNQQIQTVRKFNRQYTNTLGLLNKKVFQTNLTFPESRILIIISQYSPTTPSFIAEALNLDASYTSRIINRLKDLELIKKSNSPLDARSKQITLTDNGQDIIDKINIDSDTQIKELFSDISHDDQQKMYQAFETINKILFKKA